MWWGRGYVFWRWLFPICFFSPFINAYKNWGSWTPYITVNTHKWVTSSWVSWYIKAPCQLQRLFNKAAGPDNVRSIVLKELREELSDIITVLFQKSATTGNIPYDWTSANSCPVYKKGYVSDQASYRPISILCKTLEHIVGSKLSSRYTTHTLLSSTPLQRKAIMQDQALWINWVSCEQPPLVNIQILHV